MERIKIALIGLNVNSHSRQIYKSIMKQKDLYEVVGYVLPENERERIANKVEVLEGYPELTLDEILNNPEIEAVAIETDEVYLTKYALMAAKAGKHIHMEKPGGRELPWFEEMIETMKKTGKVFHTGYMYRYNPYVKELMAKIKSGELGQIISVEAQMNCIHPRTLRQWLGDLPGGMMFYLGCHLVDLILQIQGKPKNIIPFHKCSGLGEVTAQDLSMTVFEYENGVSFAKSYACEVGGYARRQLVVSGTKGTVELKPFEVIVEADDIYTEKREYMEKSWRDLGKSERTEAFNRYDDMMTHFAKYVRGEMENPYTLDYELELYKTVLKACGEK